MGDEGSGATLSYENRRARLTGNLGELSPEKSWASVGVAAIGTRRATEFRIVGESMVHFVGSCGEGRVGPFISPIQDLGSNRATPGTRPPLQTHPDPSSHVPRGQASPLGREYPISQPTSRKFPFLLALLRSSVSDGVFPGSRGPCHPPSFSETVCFLGIHLGAIYTQLRRFVSFVFIRPSVLKPIRELVPLPRLPMSTSVS